MTKLAARIDAVSSVRYIYCGSFDCSKVPSFDWPCQQLSRPELLGRAGRLGAVQDDCN